MPGWINYLLSVIASLFTSRKAKQAIYTATDYVAKALPIIEIVAVIVTKATPPALDDAVLELIQRQFPRLFDGSILTGEELRLYALAVATELLKAKYPELTTSIARTAVQLAYTADRAQ